MAFYYLSVWDLLIILGSKSFFGGLGDLVGIFNIFIFEPFLDQFLRSRSLLGVSDSGF